MTLPRLLAVSVLLALTTAAPAAATSCATVDASVEQVMRGEGSPGAQPFFERYDAAAVGTVLGVRSEKDGPTTVRLRLVGLLGREKAPAELDVSSPDPGWMNGYGFREGTAYFVPLRDRGEDGRADASFLCDPIKVLPDPEATFTTLEQVGREEGYPTARAGTAEPSASPTASPTVTASGGGLSPAPVLVAGGAGLAGLVGVTALVLRRRAGD